MLQAPHTMIATNGIAKGGRHPERTSIDSVRRRLGSCVGHLKVKARRAAPWGAIPSPLLGLGELRHPDGRCSPKRRHSLSHAPRPGITSISARTHRAGSRGERASSNATIRLSISCGPSFGVSSEERLPLDPPSLQCIQTANIAFLWNVVSRQISPDRPCSFYGT